MTINYSYEYLIKVFKDKHFDKIILNICVAICTISISITNKQTKFRINLEQNQSNFDIVDKNFLKKVKSRKLLEVLFTASTHMLLLVGRLLIQ